MARLCQSSCAAPRRIRPKEKPGLDHQITIRPRRSLRMMSTVKLKIDVSGTVGDSVWRNLRHFDQEKSASFEYHSANGGACKHSAHPPHGKKGIYVCKDTVEAPSLGQKGVAHYLEQERVVDADVE